MNHSPSFEIGDRVSKGIITNYQLLEKEISYEWSYVVFDKNTERHTSFFESELKSF